MKYDDDVNIPQFPSELACAAARVDPATLKNWVRREVPVLFFGKNEKVKTGDRTFYRFSFRRVMQLAIVAELVTFGIGPSDAAWMAAAFSDEENSIQERRKAGELFPRDYTVLLVSGLHHSSLVNLSASAAWRVVPRLSINPNGNEASQLLINLNQIDARVRTELGLPILARKGVS